MSKNIVDLIKFRQSALDNSSKDDVLEISHLFRGSIDPERFFSESYFTEGIDVIMPGTSQDSLKQSVSVILNWLQHPIDSNFSPIS